MRWDRRYRAARMRRHLGGLAGVGAPLALLTGAAVAVAPAAQVAVAPAAHTKFAGSGADYENNARTWKRQASGKFSFTTSGDGARILHFRGSYSYYCPDGTAYVTARYLNVSPAGKFNYRFVFRERYGTAYVEIRGAFLRGGQRARVSYLVDFVAKGKRVRQPYDTSHPRALGCASWVRGTAQPVRIYVASKDCTGHSYRPSSIMIACATGQFYVTGLRYSSYGGPTAVATGTLHLDDCKPDCARGTFRSYPGTIRLARVTACRGLLYYNQISWRYLGTSPTPSRSGSQSIRPQACSRP